MTVVQKEVKSVYLGSTKVRPSGWRPGANTIAYFPLATDTTDHSGNSYTLSLAGTQQSIGYDFTATLEIGNNFPYTTVKTAMCWGNIKSFSKTGAHQAGFLRTQPGSYLVSDGSRPNGGFYAYVNNQNLYAAAPRTSNTWMHLALTVVGADLVCYKDGVQYTVTGGAGQGGYNWLMYIASNCSGTFGVSEAIFEDRVRTAQEVSDYYNQTKGDYGIS